MQEKGMFNSDDYVERTKLVLDALNLGLLKLNNFPFKLKYRAFSIHHNFFFYFKFLKYLHSALRLWLTSASIQNVGISSII